MTDEVIEAWGSSRKEFLIMTDEVDHPEYYGGDDDPYEAIKVIEAWRLGFHLGNAVKYISRAGKKGSALTDLQKAAWYLQREIERIQESDRNIQESRSK